jgi:hypothetical protein
MKRAGTRAFALMVVSQCRVDRFRWLSWGRGRYRLIITHVTLSADNAWSPRLGQIDRVGDDKGVSTIPASPFCVLC